MGKLIWVFCFLGIWAGCSAVSGAVGGVDDDPCMTYLAGMIDCLDYVTNGSKSNKPSPDCCKELKPVMEQHPLCLCVILTPGAVIYGIAINVTRAIGLPPTCGLTPFDTSICQSPTPSPSPGPTPGPSPPFPAPVPVPPASEAPAPSPSTVSSAGMLSISIMVALFTFAVAVGSYV